MNFASKISVDEQLAILKRCVSKKINLHYELDRLGLSYENLTYRDNSSVDYSSSKLVAIEDISHEKHGVPIVSFFSGAGGLDLGFERAGFKHLASIEINPTFCQTIRLNHPDWVVIGPPNYSGDIRNREEISTVLKSKLGVSNPFEGVFIGGPPCQPFSIAANQRFSKEGDKFKRVGFSHSELGNLLFDFVWFVEQFKPIGFLLENVTGLLDIDGGNQLFEAMNLLSEAGYIISKPTIANAAHYGIPQNRNRLFVLGHRTSNQFIFPTPSMVTVPCYKAFEKLVEGLENHVTRQHKAESIIRYMELGYGERDKLGRVDRLNPNLPSKTVISGGSKGGGRSHLHPFCPRTLTVRESARLQTFPDDFIFHGSSARQFTQVGNAVPPLLASKIASAIYQQIYVGHSIHPLESSCLGLKQA
jgi:DNA (cytosine-5)-methyltransferase 1